ncbi:Putative flagellar motility protein [hydrothermal vent metagenome]|uniref:Putative flagellar motility protein n=1 Tax=hydrothermal vent metagenome TaxID=652676 RepID=A0A1W1BJ88_9ZZZZ
MNKHIKKISNVTIVGGMSAMIIATLTGCGDAPKEDKSNEPSVADAVKKEGATITILKENNTYKIVDEVPSAKTRVILQDANGTERILSDAELDKLIKEEEAKIEAGTSKLTKSPEEVTESGGMGLAGTLLAGAAAGMLGAAVMNKLQNNQNYQQNQRRSYRSPQAYSRSQSSFGNRKAGGISRPGATPTKSTTTTRRSGFGKRSTPPSRTRSIRRSGFGG